MSTSICLRLGWCFNSLLVSLLLLQSSYIARNSIYRLDRVRNVAGCYLKAKTQKNWIVLLFMKMTC